MRKSIPKYTASLVGAILTTLALSPALAQTAVFVPLGGENRILIIDAARDAIAGWIEDVPAVHGLAATPNGRFLVAGSYDERESGAAPPEKPKGVSADDHAAHHGGTSTIALGEDMVSTVSVINVEDGVTVRSIDVPGAVHHVAVSPDGAFAGVTHPNTDSVTFIDMRTYDVVTTVKTGPLPNYLVFNANGTMAYVSNAGNDTVTAINVGDWVIAWTVSVGASPEHLVLSTNGSRLYVNAVGDGTVSIIDIVSRNIVDVIETGNTPHGIDISDGGDTLFVTALGDDRLFAINLETKALRHVSLTPAPYHLATIEGTGKLYVSSADAPKLWIVDQKTLAVVGEIEIGGKGHQMVQVPQ